MSNSTLKNKYRDILKDSFPMDMEIRLGSQEPLRYEKVTWNIDGEERGLRYGENPHQPAALYRLVNGNLVLGDVRAVGPEVELTSSAKLLKSGKHPGMINITDVDAALNILRYFGEKPVTVIVKHNNPSGVARRQDLTESYLAAYMADPIAAFGGVVALNRELDAETAREICARYTEVVVAPAYSSRALREFEKKKNLRIMEIRNMDRLRELTARPSLDFTSLIDGGLVLQWAYRTSILTRGDFLPALAEYKGVEYRVERQPTETELEDMLFGWQVEAGVTSNSVLYVKNDTTVGIGTGEQDRVGCARIARDKAYEKCRERISLMDFHKSYSHLEEGEKERVDLFVTEEHGGIKGGVMVSDGFFPFRDGVEVGLKEGVTAVVQPGGSLRDFESIQACNEYGAAMMFTGERSFRH
jgi:phosphoribosylaminoimidazolecarboxamide formyltransferase/IMP cyclohydrolase